MNDEILDAIREVASIIDTVRGIPSGTTEYSAGLRVEATACVNFLRTHHATLADMAKRLEAAERDARRYRWLRDNSCGQHKHPIVVEQHPRTFAGERIGTLYVGPLFGELLDAAIDATQEGEG